MEAAWAERAEGWLAFAFGATWREMSDRDRERVARDLGTLLHRAYRAGQAAVE